MSEVQLYAWWMSMYSNTSSLLFFTYRRSKWIITRLARGQLIIITTTINNNNNSITIIISMEPL